MVLSGQWYKRLVGLLLLAMVLWGSVSRLNNLDQKSLWVDELFTLAIAQYQPLVPKVGQPLYRQIQVVDIGNDDSFLTAKAAEQSPPLYDLLVKAMLNLPVNMELASRLPAALLSCLLLFWFAAFAWRHPDPHVRRVLRWATVLVALHPALILYAQEGRAYGLGASLVGMGGLLWALRWRHGWREWQPPSWLEIALFTLACYSHYNAALLVAMLLLADASMATIARSTTAWIRLLTLGALFAIWLALNAHAIFFTAQGGVAWAAKSFQNSSAELKQDLLAVLHPPWLLIAIALAVYLSCRGWFRGTFRWLDERLVKVTALTGLTILYLACSTLMVYKAGMGHPRYYIFIIPILSIMVALIMVELRQRWLAAASLAMVIFFAEPTTDLIGRQGSNDFRSMTWAASRGSTGDTIFLYPWQPNRNYYRLYLHRFLGYDPLTSMISASFEGQASEVCAKLVGHGHIVAVAHESGRTVIDAVYSTCGEHWPMRERKDFHQTFSEHWR